MRASTVPDGVLVGRFVALDRVRGLAIVFMLADHFAYLVGVGSVRLTVGRLAMPLFFLLAGVLAHRLGHRQVTAAALGLALPLFAPWAGSPNVLVVWAVGCVLLWACARCGLPAWLLAAVGLTLAANRFPVGATSYDPAALVGLMALGSVLGKGWALALGER